MNPQVIRRLADYFYRISNTTPRSTKLHHDLRDIAADLHALAADLEDHPWEDGDDGDEDLQLV